MTRILHRLAREEDGIALVMALAIMMVLAITTTGILVAGTANQRTTYVSNQERQAFAIAQEGLAYAEGMVYAAAQSHTTPPTDKQTLNDLPVGSGSYYASVASDGVTWTMTGVGTVDGIQRTVSAQANVPGPVTGTDSGVWNYVYSDASGSSCATTINGTVTISVPIMVRGDLCLGGSTDFIGVQLEVGGNLTVSGNKAAIGSAATPVQTVRVGLTPTSTNTCTNENNPPVLPGTGACNGSTSPIYATSIAEGVTVQPQMPCIGQPSSLDSTCTGSNDGTWSTLHSIYDNQATLPKSGCPASLFDNDSTLNNSDTSISSVLLGTTAYDCKIGSASTPCYTSSTTTIPVCEISWNPTSRSLAVNGVFYFDGSLTLTGNVTYTGQATFYFTGGMQTSGGPTFCGIANCANTWDPDVNGIVMIYGCWANSTGSTLITGSSGCVGLGGGTTVQIGLYVTTLYTTAGGSSNMGPVLAGSLNLGGSAQTLIPFHYMPPGTVTNTRTIYLPASSPINWSG